VSAGRMGAPSWRVAACLLIALLANVPHVGWCADTLEETLDATFLAGLRHRRLFALAEKQCELRLADKTLSATDRGEITVEAIRTFTEHARNAATDERAELVKRAHDVAARYAAAHPEHSLVFLVRTQEALADSMLGELARLEAEVAAEPGERMNEARKLSRSATRTLEQVDRQLAEFLPQRFRKPAKDDELSVEQLAALQHQVRLQAARALRNLALAYDESSDDRIASLAKGGQLLEASLRQIGPEMPLFVPLCLELSAQQRLLGKGDAARETLSRLSASQVSSEQQLAARAETARLALALNRLDDAEKLIALDSRLTGSAEADWDFCRLEVLLARWRERAARKQDVDELQQQALQWLDEIERDHGPFWKLRGDLLLVRLGGAAGTRNPDLVARTADSLVAQGRFDEALAAYDDALGQARESRREAAVFVLGYKSGLLQQKRERHVEAANRLRDASLAAPSQPKAAAAHLAAAWNLAQEMRRDSSAAEGEQGERYEAWLREHLEKWPADESSNEARVWLGSWLAVAGRWRDATPLFRAVPESSSQRLVAWRGALRAALKTLDDRETLASERENFARETLEWLDATTPPQDPTAADSLSLATLRFRCEAAQPGHGAAAQRALDAWENATLPQYLETIDWLRSLQANATDDRRRELATLTLAAIERTRAVAGTTLTAPQQRQLEGASADSLAKVGRRAEAIDAFRKLATVEPTNGDVQQSLAELYESGTTPADGQLALDQWRRIAAKSPPRSPRWFRAKLGVATALLRTGQRDEAIKFIRFLQTSPPGLEGTPWAADFEKLLK